MEPKVICVLLLVFSLALSTLAQGQAETCTMTLKQRVNCGYSGITAYQCEQKGCCFDNTIPDYPWCFYPLNLENDLPEEECVF